MGNYENLKQSITEVIRTNGNQEITGAVLQSTLLTIISTVGANATFAGVATPTTNPGTPDGSVFYLASEGGTYSNFNAIELQAGLSVLMWNGTWSSQQVFGIDNEPTAGSNNLVKSGGVAEELALGAVYDVSAKNPTGGSNNDGKWESLSALLSDANLNTLIPTAVRKGGMSIKFVQSSDNKYVQFRCKTQSFSTNPEDWYFEGDDTLVENPEYLRVITDGAGHLLGWIRKKDGGIDWVVGVPKPVKDYVNTKITEIWKGTDGTQLDGLNKVITFLDEFSTSETLKQYLNENYGEYIENPEYLKVDKDKDGRFLGGYLKDGTRKYQNLWVADNLKLSKKACDALEKDMIGFYNSSYSYTISGIGGSIRRFDTHYILKAGVTYKISFSSTKIEPSVSGNDAWGLYLLGAKNSLNRINLYSGNSIPSAFTLTYNEDYLLYAVCQCTKDSFVNITIEPQSQILNNLVKNNADNINEMTIFRRELLSGSFTNGDVVSDLKYKTAMTDGCDYQDATGRLAIGYIGTEGYGEFHIGDGWDLNLIICNLASPAVSKKEIPCIQVNETINGETFTLFQHAVAVWTDEDEITVLAECTSNQRYGLRARKYNVTSETWSDVYVCDVAVSGVSEPIEMISNANKTDWTNVNAFWNATGVEHPMGRGGEELWWFAAGCPIKIGEYFYMSMVTGNYAHPLLRTQDLVHFEFVSDIPYSDGNNEYNVWSPSEEVEICYAFNRIYAITRGNYNYFTPEANPHNLLGWNTILYCNFDNLSSDNWSKPVVMEQYSFERCSICEANGYIFTLQGVTPHSAEGVDGSVTQRQRKGMVIYDKDLNIVRSAILTFNTPCLHPLFLKYPGTIISVQSSDVRGFAITHDGDGRAEIMVTRLNPQLMFMACDKK